MRNKYSKQFEIEMQQQASKSTLNELLNIAQQKYKYQINEKQLRQYLSKRKIRYKNYNSFKIRNVGNKIPVGTEYVKDDGMTLIKISPTKWMYKQRYIYEQHYNVKLNSDDYVIFLDQNRNNFDISNLKKITRHESSILSNQKMFSKNPELTKTGILVAKLMIKAKEKTQ